jgi:flagellar motor protein MotB
VPMAHACRDGMTQGLRSLTSIQTATFLTGLLICLAVAVGCSVANEPPLARVEKELKQSLHSPITAGDMTVRRMNQRLTVVLTEPLLFDPGSDTISPKGLAVLKHIGAVFKTAPLMEIRVTGHSDRPVTIDRSKEFLFTLASSKARATYVVGILKESGVDPRALFIEWYGDIRPIASNGTEEGRQRNRRIEIAVTPWIPEPENPSVLPGHAS